MKLVKMAEGEQLERTFRGHHGAVSGGAWGGGGKEEEEETHIPTNGCRFLDKLLRNAILRLPLPRSSK